MLGVRTIEHKQELNLSQKILHCHGLCYGRSERFRSCDISWVVLRKRLLGDFEIPTREGHLDLLYLEAVTSALGAQVRT